ncbi:hypothetical protein PIB30_100145, partial [Stylosanthes scabra]|nr:hypothetical protein [Stylosanthes scabra]
MDRIDSIDISLISQAEEMRMLRDWFLELVGEVLSTTEPTAEVPTADTPVTDEVTRIDDPAVEGTTEVAPVATDQVVADSVETVQEQSVEAP